MADIAMCRGAGCDKKENCYRFKAKPDTYQSYFVEAPIDNGYCDSFWPIEDDITQKDADIIEHFVTSKWPIELSEKERTRFAKKYSFLYINEKNRLALRKNMTVPPNLEAKVWKAKYEEMCEVYFTLQEKIRDVLDET